MAAKIRVLPEVAISRIAAGEVIENTASCVKELIENAIDAESDEITVEIKSGGRQLIRITDNGVGMSQDDAILCFERHATSKIFSEEDVFGVTSMGFRGEAIPSMASISKMSVLTKTKSDKEGFIVVNHGGKIIKTANCARTCGTTVKILSLFYNVPVRKRFQRPPSYDAAAITRIVGAFAIAYPDIKFQLISDGHHVFNLPRPRKEQFLEKLAERISDTLGRDFFVGLIPVEYREKEAELVGYLGLPTFTRNNRTGQHLFINRRSVVSPFFSCAVKEGYGFSIAPNRFPVFVLFLNLHPCLVDVNVHPQKKEVRLRKEQELRDFARDAVQNSLGASCREERISAASVEHFPSSPIYDSLKIPKSDFVVSGPDCAPQRTYFLPEAKKIDVPHVVATLPGYLISLRENDDILFVKQNRAHARIIFEELRKGDNGFFPVQQLLVPYNIEMSVAEAAVVKERLADLHKLGIEMDTFGKSGFAVTALPSFLTESGLKSLLFDVAAHFGKKDNLEKQKEERLASLAAKGSVSGGRKLTVFEGQDLLDRLYECVNYQLCPFGKKIFFEMTKDNLAMRF